MRPDNQHGSSAVSRKAHQGQDKGINNRPAQPQGLQLSRGREVEGGAGVAMLGELRCVLQTRKSSRIRHSRCCMGIGWKMIWIDPTWFQGFEVLHKTVTAEQHEQQQLKTNKWIWDYYACNKFEITSLILLIFIIKKMLPLLKRVYNDSVPTKPSITLII